MNEYQELSVRQLLIKALDTREDSGPLLQEAERRDLSMIDRLTAVVEQTVGTEWTPVESISMDDGDLQIAVCIRRIPKVDVPQENMRSVQADEPMRSGGGSWRDAGRTGR